jgi:putative oxidoreductase
MDYLVKIKAWGDSHHRSWMDPLRMAFGVALMLKGLYYIYNSEYAIHWLQSGLFFKEAAGSIALLLAFFHISLGLLIMLGALTRFASALLAPVILIAVAFANPELTNPLEILFSIMVLGLCVFFFIEGSGKFSIYAYMSNPKTSPQNMATEEDSEIKSSR